MYSVYTEGRHLRTPLHCLNASQRLAWGQEQKKLEKALFFFGGRMTRILEVTFFCHCQFVVFFANIWRFFFSLFNLKDRLVFFVIFLKARHFLFLWQYFVYLDLIGPINDPKRKPQMSRKTGATCFIWKRELNETQQKLLLFPQKKWSSMPSTNDRSSGYHIIHKDDSLSLSVLQGV